MATPLFPGYYKSRDGALRAHRQLRTSVFGPFGLSLEPFFRRRPFIRGPELGKFLTEANPPQTLQLLGDSVLNKLTAARKESPFDELVDLLESLWVQGEGDLGAAYGVMVSLLVGPGKTSGSA